MVTTLPHVGHGLAGVDGCLVKAVPQLIAHSSWTLLTCYANKLALDVCTVKTCEQQVSK
jgi:hypothetical protein